MLAPKNKQTYLKSMLSKAPQADLERLARLFSVLSEASRLKILQSLREGEKNVHEICQDTGLKQSNASRQLSALHNAELLKRTKRGLSVYYAIQSEDVVTLCDALCSKMNKPIQM